MKIGIITQPLRSNYGGILQNFALQTVLRRMSHQPVTINRLCLKYEPTTKEWMLIIMKNVVKTLLRYHVPRHIDPLKFARYEEARTETCRPFIDNHIVKIDHADDLTEDFCKKHLFDAYISGSDQVWRPCYSYCLANDYLDFTQNFAVKRIAYAASFGVDRWEYTPEQTALAANLIRSYDAVSVREESGIDLCLKYLGKEAIRVLDPTMLLCAEDYKAIANNAAAGQPGNSCVTYILDPDKKKKTIIRKICDNKKLSEISIGNDARHYPCVEYWLDSIRRAQFVVTDSFHGTVFSILFRKPFIAIANSARGATRFRSLLKMVDLENRLVEPTCSAERLSELTACSIDYERIEQLLENHRKHSMSFLSQNLHE